MKKLPRIGEGFVMLLAVAAFTVPAKRPPYPLINIKGTYMTQDTIAPVKVELENTSFKDLPVLFIHDTAATTEMIKVVLGKGFGELMQYVNANKLRPGRFMAWYYAMEPPWSLDIAIETDRVPGQPTGRIQSRVQPGGEVLIAHVSGPYDQVGQAYMKIGNWLRQNKRKAKGCSFEVYINDPSTVKNPSEIRTDIYQPIE